MDNTVTQEQTNYAEIIDIFATSVMVFNLNRPYTEDEVSAFRDIGDNLKINYQNRVSKNNTLLHTYPQFSNIKVFFENCVKQYVLNVLDPLKDLELEITNSWSQFTPKGEWHEVHNHPNSIVSGVLYFQTQPTDKIVFQKPFPALRIKAKNATIRNGSQYWLPCDVGRLIIFPSDLLHRVLPVEYDGVRISMAFNTWIKNEKGLARFDFVD